MTELDDLSCYLTGTGLRQQIFNYFPQQFLKDVDPTKIGLNNSEFLDDEGEEIFQKLFENSNRRLRMYELPCGYLAFEFKKQRNFTSSHQYYGMNIQEPYNKVITTFSALNKKEFIVKQDIFPLIQSLILAEKPDLKLLPLSIMSIYLKTGEKKLSECHEYVEYDKRFDEIRKMICDGMIRKMIESMDSPRDTMEDPLEKWKRLIPEFSDEQFEPIRDVISAYLELNPPRIFGRAYDEVYSWSKRIVELIRDIMEKYPDMFIPYSQKKTSESPPITCRLFHSRGRYFMMKYELNRAMGRLTSNKKLMEYEDTDPFLMAIEMPDAEKIYRNKLKKINLIITPIQETSDKKALPIMTPTGDYCTLAGDALLQIIWRAIHQRQLFQRIKTQHQKKLDEFWHILRQWFSPDKGCRYFIKLSTLPLINSQLDVFCSQFDNIPVKEVRNAKPTGFTLQNLKNEFIHLELTEIFPHIQMFSANHYKTVLKDEPLIGIKTWHLFFAVGKSQIDSLMLRCLEIYDFLHTQQEEHILCRICYPNRKLYDTVLGVLVMSIYT